MRKGAATLGSWSSVMFRTTDILSLLYIIPACYTFSGVNTSKWIRIVHDIGKVCFTHILNYTIFIFPFFETNSNDIDDKIFTSQSTQCAQKRCLDCLRNMMLTCWVKEVIFCLVIWERLYVSVGSTWPDSQPFAVLRSISRTSLINVHLLLVGKHREVVRFIKMLRSCFKKQAAMRWLAPIINAYFHQII